MNKNVSLFLDSGAYSAMTQNISIDIYEYIDFIKQNNEYIDIYACLDVIGDPVETYKNQKIMMKHGLNPLITFHKREDFKWLKKYIEEFDYIALGGISGTGDSKSYVRQHLDDCWNIICDTKDRLPKIKIHGFGLTALDLMWRYPWYSVDSTSWVQTGRFGSVYVPKYKQGKYSYDENSLKVAVSNQSPSQKEEGQHFSTFSPMEQNQILTYFKEKGFVMGKSDVHKEDKKTYKLKEGERWINSIDAESCRDLIENTGTYVPSNKLAMRDIVETIIEPGLSNDYRLRDELNIIYFLDLEDAMPKWPWPFKLSKGKGFDL